jgi:Fe-S cluster assembly iron-binding protein IscA
MTDVIAVTDRAVKQIATILKDEPQGAMLRVGVDGGGCSGFQYTFAV